MCSRLAGYSKSMISSSLKSIVLILLFLSLSAPVAAVQIKTIGFSGLDEAQILNVRSELSLADTQLDTTTVISENRLDYLLRLAPREIRRGLEAFGYYDAQVESKVVREGENVNVYFTVVPGQ
jgi:hypothetical protein